MEAAHAAAGSQEVWTDDINAGAQADAKAGQGGTSVCAICEAHELHKSESEPLWITRRGFMMSAIDDRKYMRRAIALAKAGEGWVHPNPLVGAVIVKDGRVIGEGYHRKFGELHAERNAIASLTEPADGATIYVTLEPCCHYGKTPPCTEAIIENRIARVVIGSRDPNPLVAGKGAAILQEAGIEVEEDFLREECDAINPVFFHYITEKTPYVIMKYAMTADGKIATKTGASKWITGPAAREEVHRIRHACMGIMAGIGTVLADDPMLNCRMGEDDGDASSLDVRQPIRIICDSYLRIPADSQICRTAREYETIVVCADPSLTVGEIVMDDLSKEIVAEYPAGEITVSNPSGEASDHPTGFDPQERQEQMSMKIRQLQQLGITVMNVPEPQSAHVDLRQLMQLLGERGIDSILLEGGSVLNDSALRAGIVSEVRAFVAPKLFGGTAKSPVEGIGIEQPDEAIRMKLINVEMFGEDLMLRYKVFPKELDV